MGGKCTSHRPRGPENWTPNAVNLKNRTWPLPGRGRCLRLNTPCARVRTPGEVATGVFSPVYPCLPHLTPNCTKFHQKTSKMHFYPGLYSSFLHEFTIKFVLEQLGGHVGSPSLGAFLHHFFHPFALRVMELPSSSHGSQWKSTPLGVICGFPHTPLERLFSDPSCSTTLPHL